MIKSPTYRRVLLDTGPLVAIASGRDANHHSCVATLHDIEPPLLCCWPVLTETAWLLRRRRQDWEAVLAGLDQGVFTLLPLAAGELRAIDAIMKRYNNLPLQLADAALVHLADRENTTTVLSLDHRDLSVVRTRSRKRLILLPIKN